MKLRTAVALALGVVASCNDQVVAQRGGWLIEATALVSPTNPTVENRVYAWFDYVPEVSELFASARLSLLSTDAAFFDYHNPPGITGNDPLPAPVMPTAINGLAVSQFHFPPMFVGNPANPLLVVVAHWRPEHFAPRFVTITAEARPSFNVYRSLNGSGATLIANPISGTFRIEVTGSCYPDCDTSTGVNVLDVFDFLCFQNRYDAGAPYACDCDTSTGPGLCDIFDFLCFQNAFAAGCP